MLKCVNFSEIIKKNGRREGIENREEYRVLIFILDSNFNVSVSS